MAAKKKREVENFLSKEEIAGLSEAELDELEERDELSQRQIATTR